MFELYLILYVLAVLVGCAYTLKHYGLLMKSPIEQLAEKKVLAEQVMKALHGASCPLCGGNTYVERTDLFRTNIAVLVCEGKCRQKSMWKLEGHVWHLIGPYRYVPALVTKLETPKVEEEIVLEFG